MTHDDLGAWIDRYVAAWRAPGTDALARLFAPGATYAPAPFDEVLTGAEAIAAFWEAEREGADEAFALAWEPVAVEGDVGVARVEVTYARGGGRTYRDLWVVTLDPDGRARAFEEWPFLPGQPRAAA